MYRIQAFILLISSVTICASSKSPCETGTYPDYKGEICMRILDVSASYSIASRFCKIYENEPLKVRSNEEHEYINLLITNVLKRDGDFWIANEANSTGHNKSSCSFISSTTEGIQVADCNESKYIICMKTSYSHYVYNVAVLGSDIKSLKEQFSQFASQCTDSMHKLEEKMQEISHYQEDMKRQLNAIKAVIENTKSERGLIGNAENGNVNVRRNKVSERCSEPPKIIRSPFNDTIIVIEGSELRLKCNSIGNPQPKVQWSRKSDYIATIGDEYPLHFISRSDAGEYICIADNNIGPPVNETFNVVVLFRPIFTSPLTTIETHIHEILTLKSRFEADPKPEAHWYKDRTLGELNSTTTHIGGQTYESMIIVQINSDEDLGMYRCVAKNSVGQSTLAFHIIGRVPNVTITTIRNKNTFDHKSFQIKSLIHSDSPASECLLLINAKTENPMNISVTLRQKEQTSKNEYTEIIDSERIGHSFKPNTKYFIKMKCMNKNGWSKYSNTVYIITHYVCGQDVAINGDQCHYLTSHPEYGKLPYTNSYKCSSTIRALNCSNLRTVVVEMDHSLKDRCAAPRNAHYFASIQIKELNERNNQAFNYICNSGENGIVSQSNQVTLELNKIHVDSTHGFKLCFKCENLNIN